MPNLSSLRITLNQTKDEIKNKQVLASKLRASAETHRDNGDEATASNEENSASKYESEVQDAEVSLTIILAQIASKESEIKDIEEARAKLDKEYQKEKSRLDDELKRAA